jgi:hypothetical protein
MSGKIYLIQDDNTLQALSQQPYANEDLLQTHLAQYPDLLAGEQMNEATPRRWLLVSREVTIPDDEEGAGRLSLDHLFLDQDAIPTLVEVKRSSDTRIRREVVGQMLDYAANAVVYLPVEAIRASFEATCDSQGDDPTQLVAELMGTDLDDEEAVEIFWRQVKTNLQAGRIRLVFVADEIAPELRRIVEFLNQQMDPAEVLAVEIKQYVGPGIKTLVPQVIGQTAIASQKKSGSRAMRKQWDESSFFVELERRFSPVEVEVARDILAWARSKMSRISWGQGSRSGSFVPILHHGGTDHQLFAVWTYGTVEIYFYWYQYKPPFDAEEKRLALLDRLNAIPGVSIPQEAISRRPSFSLSLLQNEAARQGFLDTFEWAISEIQAV